VSFLLRLRSADDAPTYTSKLVGQDPGLLLDGPVDEVALAELEGDRRRHSPLLTRVRSNALSGLHGASASSDSLTYNQLRHLVPVHLARVLGLRSDGAQSTITQRTSTRALPDFWPGRPAQTMAEMLAWSAQGMRSAPGE